MNLIGSLCGLSVAIAIAHSALNPSPFVAAQQPAQQGKDGTEGSAKEGGSGLVKQELAVFAEADLVGNGNADEGMLGFEFAAGDHDLPAAVFNVHIPAGNEHLPAAVGDVHLSARDEAEGAAVLHLNFVLGFDAHAERVGKGEAFSGADVEGEAIFEADVLAGDLAGHPASFNDFFDLDGHFGGGFFRGGGGVHGEAPY